MARKKSMNLSAKADPQLQFEFYTQKLKPGLQQAARGERKVFFVDAAHFVLGSFLGLVWCFARPLVRTSPGRQRYSVPGAIERADQREDARQRELGDGLRSAREDLQSTPPR